MMTVKIKNNDSILFIGDSITDCDRRDVNRPLGNGYVKLFNDLMIVREPAKGITIINKGIGGSTVKDLQNRWYDDVLRHKPDWLSIKIGINDLHRYIAKTSENVNPEEFIASYDDILSQTKQKLPQCKILLIEPFYISNETSKTSFRHDVLKLIPEYISVVRKMHQKYRTRIINTHTLFSKLLKYYENDTFCQEPVHPNSTGHLVIAEAVYSALSK
jgi:lysophospholipase L1-like esterase